MAGLRIIVPGLQLPDTAPRLIDVDPIETNGSLLLVEPGHPVRPWGAGVPADNATVPNVLWERAVATYGGGVEADVSPTVDYANLDGTRGLAERTTKGGLHVILSQDDARVADTSDPYFGILYDLGLREWQYLHPTNDLYVSAWVVVTRIKRTGTVAGTYSGESPVYLYTMRVSGGNQRIRAGDFNPIGTDLGVRNNLATATGAALISTASSGWTTPPGSETATNPYGLTLGAYPGSLNTALSSPNTAQARWPSYVVYRWYVEDLAVSQRDPAEVDALDLALFTREVLTVGGRYYGDTFTDPATIP